MSSLMNSFESLGPFFTGGTHLLTSPEEIEMASIVYNLSLEEISLSSEITNDSNGAANDDDDDPRIEVSRENLERILKLFEHAGEAREKFVKNFQLWQILRQDNIFQLKDLIRLLREEKKKCGVGLLVGGTAALIGGAAVTGALLFPPAAPALLPAAVSAYIPAAMIPAATAAAAYLPSFLLPAAAAAPAAASGAMTGGLAAAGIGGAAAAGSAATLLALGEKRLGEAREVIKADEMAFESCVEEWFRHTQGLIEATEELLGFDVMEGWVKDLNTQLSWCKQDSQLLARKDLFMAGIKLCILRFLPRLGAALPGFSAAFLASMLTFLFCLFWLKHRSLFQQVSNMRSLCGSRLRSLDLSTLLTTTAGVAQVAFLMSRRGATLGAFAVLGLLGSVATLVLSSLDLREGGDGNKRADPVEKVVEKLQEELDILEEVYYSLVTV